VSCRFIAQLLVIAVVFAVTGAAAAAAVPIALMIRRISQVSKSTPWYDHILLSIYNGNMHSSAHKRSAC
jgi:hypothetical protein